MNWSEIRAAFSRSKDKLSTFKRLSSEESFWEADAKALFCTAALLAKHECFLQSFELLQVVEDRVKPKAIRDVAFLKGDLLHELEHFEEAVLCYSDILEREEDACARVNRALAYWELGEHEKALNDYFEAIKLNPLSTVALRGADEMLLKLGKPERQPTQHSRAPTIKRRSGRKHRGALSERLLLTQQTTLPKRVYVRLRRN